jgi:outer membrane lipoprotein-sorting protein
VSAYAGYSESYSKLSSEDKIIVDKIDRYFVELKTLKGSFIQSNNFDGTMAEGIFYVHRPEKLRFEYTNPFKSILITNGKATTFYDVELDEISTLPTSATPLSFLLKYGQGLRELGFTITSVNVDNSVITVKTESKNNGKSYMLNFTFDRKTNKLKGLDLDNDEQSLSLEFINLEENINLDKNLFIFKNPRLYRRRK